MTRIISWGQYSFRSHLFQPPGNSLRHIDVAYGYGYDGVELDVQLTKNDELVLMHDATLDRTTASSGRVSDYTSGELSTVRLKDPWDGPACYIETLEAALIQNGRRGPVMVDMHNVVPRTAVALRRSVWKSGFRDDDLILLSYTADGGALYKSMFPDATVLLKARHDLRPPELNVGWFALAKGLDGILVPIANDPVQRRSFANAKHGTGLKLGVYTHDSDRGTLDEIFALDIDYVTSIRPEVFGAVKNKYRCSSTAATEP